MIDRIALAFARSRCGRASAVLFWLAAFALPAAVSAGPPYVTDDPVPTDYRNWEIYTGLQYQNQCCGDTLSSLPFAELNYGAMPNVQVSTTVQMSLTQVGTVQTYRFGPTQFGVKMRFVQEAGGWPQVAFYPSVESPIAAGQHLVTFLPLWLQKSWGPWTAYGGGGEYLNGGPGQRDYSFIGATLQRALSPATTIGAEIYHQGAEGTGEPDMTATNVGVISQMGANHAILFSFGRAFHGENTFSAYASYEFELGPASGK